MQNSSWSVAVSATLHCLTGCAIGEITGNVIGSGLNWNPWPTELLAIGLAFFFGYSLTMRPLLAHGFGFQRSVRLALASDTFSIATMEIVDTIIMLSVPGALTAGPATGLFWASLLASLVVAFVAAVPVNRYLITRGKGHAVIHASHNH
jgi:hypothetical protein